LSAFGGIAIPTRFASGGVLYRTGPDPERDGIVIAGHGKSAEHSRFAHFWLATADRQLIDFSVADWRAGVAAPGPVWTISSPLYHRDAVALFRRPRDAT
jgi:hypothetical protein